MEIGDKITVQGSRTQRFQVTLASDRVTCQRCGAPIYWTTTFKGKRMPIDEPSLGVATAHFATCTSVPPRVG